MKPLSNLNILIVDDEADIREILVHDFEVAHCKVHSAGSGKEGIEIMLANKLDVIISDMHMQNGSGEDILFACRQLPPETKPVVIFISGLSEPSEEVLFDLGSEGYLSKPFSRRDLIETVTRSVQSIESRWKFNPSLIPREAIQLEIELEDIGKSIKNRTFNIGVGGLFVAIDGDLPRTREIIHFNIAIGPRDYKLKGAGVVRWTRASLTDGNPPGIGIEILTLENDSIEKIQKLQSEFPTRAFIPRH